MYAVWRPIFVDGFYECWLFNFDEKIISDLSFVTTDFEEAKEFAKKKNKYFRRSK